MPTEFEGLPKLSFRSRRRERLQKVLKKEPKPAVPEGAKPEPEEKKPHTKGGAVQNLEDRVIQQQDVEGLMKILTPREREVYELVVTEGRTNVEAARILGVSDEAIRQRRASISSKTRLKFKK